MTDPLTWTIDLGRWAGIRARIHWSLPLFLGLKLLSSALSSGHPVLETACWGGLLLLALAVHELGHIAASWWFGVEPDDIRLWPLGNLTSPSREPRSPEAIWVALAGPLASLIAFFVGAVAVNLSADAEAIWSPFGNGLGSGGAPLLIAKAGAARAAVPAFSVAWFAGWFAYLNIVLFWANLIPALPFDGGRAFRALLANISSVPSRESSYAPYTSRVVVLLLTAVGLIKLLLYSQSQAGAAFALFSLALVVEWMFRLEARFLEDGGFFDDTLFGYDFSEGYTSLDSASARVRPHPQWAITRWKSRRTEARRLRKAALEAEQDRRVDELLQKIYDGGRESLSADERRFLERASRDYRKKTGLT
ncbi:M50 family metallopeptidase [Isosphaeraceae bacterium EP7]